MADALLSSWETYFEEVSLFISSLGRGRISFANQEYTEYVIERMGYCISSLEILIEHLDPADLDENEADICSLPVSVVTTFRMFVKTF